MKQTELLRQLRKIAKDREGDLKFVRHGAKHDIYECAGVTIQVPRHADINEYTAKGILRDAGKD